MLQLQIADTHGNARHLSASGPDLLATADLNKNFKEHPGTLSSGSSVEPHSDCSFTDTEQILNVCLIRNETVFFC